VTGFVDLLAAAPPASQVFETAALVAPLGISPLLALAVMGGLAHHGYLSLPPSLAALSFPVVWGGLMGLAALLHVGKSSKLTRPLAETVGTGESLMAVVAAFLLFVGPPASGPVVQAGAAGTWWVATAATVAVVLVLALRTALDLLIWLSPIPLVDAAFELAKAVLTLGLALLVVVSPVAALICFAAMAIAAILLLRWVIRTVRRALARWRQPTRPGPLGPMPA
jgi:hypothetical protein